MDISPYGFKSRLEYNKRSTVFIRVLRLFKNVRRMRKRFKIKSAGHVDITINIMAQKYSTPKLHIPKELANGKKRPTVAPGKKWYVYFYFDDPNTGKRKQPFKVYRGINEFKSVSERKRYGAALISTVAMMLADGMDSYDEKVTRENLNKASALDIYSAELPKLTISQAFSEGLKAKALEVSPKTYEGYAVRVGPFLEWCNKKKIGPLPIESFKKRYVQAYLNMLGAAKPMGKGLKPTSVHNVKLAISAVMAKLSAMGIVERNVIKEIVTKKNKPERNAPFTPKEVEKIREHCLQHDQLQYNFIRFIFYSFMRNVEIVRIQLFHIDMEAGVIAIPTKSDKLSFILMIEPMRKYLESLHLERYPKDSFLFTMNGVPGIWDASEGSRVDFFSRRFKKIRKLFDIDPKKNIYSFRHNAALDLYHSFIADGLNEHETIAKLMKITLHKSPEALRNYLRDIVGTYHKIKAKYLQLYLNEFIYKLNRRYFGDKIFDRLVIASIATNGH